MFFISTSGVPSVNTLDLRALTLAGLTGTSPVLDPVAVNSLNNWLSISEGIQMLVREHILNAHNIILCLLKITTSPVFVQKKQSLNNVIFLQISKYSREIYNYSLELTFEGNYFVTFSLQTFSEKLLCYFISQQNITRILLCHRSIKFLIPCFFHICCAHSGLKSSFSFGD